MQLGDLKGVALAFVVIGVVFALGLVILDKMRDSASLGNDAEAAVNASITALSEIPNNWLLIVAVVIAGVVVLGLIFTYLGGAGAGRR